MEKMKSTRRSHSRAKAWPALSLVALLCGVSAQAQDCEVKIGAVGPMTGGGASWGLAGKAGTEFEAAWVNQHGGLPMGGKKCKVTVLSFDSLSTAAGGAAAANYMASQNVHAVVGPIPSPENTGFKPVGKRADILNITTAFAADSLSAEFPLTFHQLQTPPVWGPLVVKAARDRFNLKTAVVIGPNDQGGTDPGKALAKIYNELGVKTSTEWYQRGTANFSAIAARLMASTPDAVELGPMPPGEAAILVKQMWEAGYTGAFGRLGAGGDVIINLSGGPEKQNAFYWFDHTPTQDPGIKKLRADFEGLMKVPVPDNTLIYNAQISAEIVLKAISAAGTDQSGEKIAAELRKMAPESRYLGKAGWRGKTQYGINQELSFPVGLSVIIKGKPQPQIKIDIPTE